MTRSELYTHYYFSTELKKASEYLLREYPNHQSIAQDLLSDSLIEVFKKTDSQLNDLHERGKLKSYIFLCMRNVIYNGNYSKSFRDYGLNSVYGNDQSQIESVESEIETLEITKDEHEFSKQLFGCTTDLNVRFMREIEKADNNKANDIDTWEAAQICKLYFEFKSFRKVSKATGIGREQINRCIKKFTSILTNEKMKITVVTHEDQPKSGMELYRLHYPYFDGIHATYSDQSEIKRMTYNYILNESSHELEDDVYVFSRLQNVSIANRVIKSGKKLVIDIDDYWNLNIGHPLNGTEQNKNYVKNITAILPMAHLVTCSTQPLAERLKEELGIDATIIKNTIPIGTRQFYLDKFKHDKVRFGWVGGIHHMEDLKQCEEGMEKVYSDVQMRGKFQICLGGYNPNSHFDEYEKILTANFKLGNGEQDYIDYLKLKVPLLNHTSFNKPYKRIWFKPVHAYGLMYNELDVVLIPKSGKLKNGNVDLFGSCKSELKLIEAGTMNKAAIVSDAMPYSPHLENEVNCLTVKENSVNWYTQIRRLTFDKELRMELADNLTKYVKKNFSHKVETEKLFNVLKKLK